MDRLQQAEKLLRDVLSEFRAFDKGDLSSDVSPTGDSEHLFGPFQTFSELDDGEMILGPDEMCVTWPNAAVIATQINEFLGE